MSQKWKEFDLEYDYLVTPWGPCQHVWGAGRERTLHVLQGDRRRGAIPTGGERAIRVCDSTGGAEGTHQEIAEIRGHRRRSDGVELASCTNVYQDVAKTFPRRLLDDVSIEIIDLQEKILSTYDRRIAEYATDFSNGRTSSVCWGPSRR